MPSRPRNASRNRTVNGDFGRDSSGRFGPGNAGNPFGRPKLLPELKQRIQERGQYLIDRLFEIVDPEPQLVRRGRRVVAVGPSHKDRVLAIKLLLGYGYGRPPLAIEITRPGDGSFAGATRDAIDEVITQAEAERAGRSKK
jgi:hypothetical protein